MKLTPALTRMASVAVALLAGTMPFLTADERKPDALSAQLRELDATVMPAEQAKEKQLGQMLQRSARARLTEANDRDREAWRAIKTREQWEEFRDERIKKLREKYNLEPVPDSEALRITPTS